MAQFEEYLRKQQEVNKENPYQQYYEQVNKELEYKRHPYAMDYTAEDMGEMFEDRMKNTTYQQRTQYYFEDHNYLLAKAKRYVKMSEDEEALKKYGPCPLHRMSYAPVRKILFEQGFEQGKLF